ncbi:MAG: hypothetical protein FWF92_05075 [Oscillospiraceae bacterium]|nr:hypothetical protein [Oscillospiraceae bacterium]
MKKISLIFIYILIVLGIFSGCEKKSDDTGEIEFEYMYRGFTSVNEEEMSEEYGLFTMVTYENALKIIFTIDDWGDFMGKYCPGIPYDIMADFQQGECIVVIIGGPVKSNYTSSYYIDKITVNDSKLDIQGNYYERIYGLNKNGQIHFFLNIVVVNKNDLPQNLDDNYIYKK